MKVDKNAAITAWNEYAEQDKTEEMFKNRLRSWVETYPEIATFVAENKLEVPEQDEGEARGNKRRRTADGDGDDGNMGGRRRRSGRKTRRGGRRGRRSTKKMGCW